MKVGIIGNTVLTYKTAQFLLSRGCHIAYVFGLPPEKLKNKVNAYDLKSFCRENKIQYIEDNDWSRIQDISVDMVYEMGDSRIVPKSFVNSHTVIGNHGALLPAVQGAASLVWGRILNSGEWGVSLMKLSEEIDGGDVLNTKKVFYEKSIISMKEFAEMCDNITIECVKEHFDGKHKPKSNRPWQVKVAKNLDSSKVVDILKLCLEKGIAVYLPPRRPKDGKINNNWDPEFVSNFMIANDTPYPRYFTEE